MKAVKKTLSKAIFAALLPAGALIAGSGSALAQDQDQAESELMLEEVVVTARKIEENLQEVPVAVTALTAEYMADLGISDLSDISKVTAGLVFDSEFARGANRPRPDWMQRRGTWRSRCRSAPDARFVRSWPR